MAGKRKPASSPDAKPFADKAKDLNALRDSVVDAASVGAGLWLSYLFLLFYLFVAAAAITHKDLLFENPVKLPFLSVELPLIGFFWLWPLLFLVLHTYVLLHFRLLASKVGAFNKELNEQLGGEANHSTRTALRRQLPSNIFVQYLAGPEEVRTGVMGFMLRMIAWLTLIVFPIALLVFFQLQFLPYHSETITWWHRFAVLIDIVLLWFLWPGIARGDATWISWQDFTRPLIAGVALASLLPLLLVFTIATFPGERLDRLPHMKILPTKWPSFDRPVPLYWLSSGPSRPDLLDFIKSMEWTSLHNALVSGDVDLVERKPTSLWSNVLVLPGLKAIDHAKSATDVLSESLSLRGRNLEGAVLIGADLRKVDLTGAQLQGAKLDRADLRGAKFGCTKAKLTEGGTECAHLQRVSLQFAELPGAELDFAELQGATLDDAELQGASLKSAQLQGASLRGTHLEAASLNGAQFYGSLLEGTKLQATSLGGAKMLGLSLSGVSFEGASLGGAELQGTLFDDVDLSYAYLDGVGVWRAVPEYINEGSAEGDENTRPFAASFERKAQYRALDCQDLVPCDWSESSFETLKAIIEEYVSSDLLRAITLQQAVILNPARSFEADKERGAAEVWDRLERSSPPHDVYEKNLVHSLRRTGCKPRGAPYAVRGLIRQLDDGRFWLLSPQTSALATIFLDEANCPGAVGLSQEDRIKLKELRDRFPGLKESAPQDPSSHNATPQ